jgi:inner membrane transporter RhtA
VVGVYLLTGVESVGSTAALGFAFANAALFTAYIVLAHRLSRFRVLSSIDGFAAAMVCALVFVTPIGGWTVLPALADPVAIAAGVGVGVSSSVVPYVLDQLAMARLPRSTYALFVSLLPATATVVGALVLRQIPSAVELAGIALVMLGVAIHRPEGATPRDRRSRSRRARTRSARSS